MKTSKPGICVMIIGLMLAGPVMADHPYGDGARYHGGYWIPSWARDVGDGWIIGSKPEPGGFAIYRWNGYHWHEVHGAGIRIGGSYYRPWHVNDRGHRYVWNGHEWHRDYNYHEAPVFKNEHYRRHGVDVFRESRGGVYRQRHGERYLRRQLRNRW